MIPNTNPGWNFFGAPPHPEIFWSESWKSAGNPKMNAFQRSSITFSRLSSWGCWWKKSSTQFWLLMIHKKEVFAKNRSARSRGVGRPYFCRANEYLRVCPPRHLILAPPSPHRDLRICSLLAIGWCQEFSKVSKRTHLHRKTHENASNKCNFDAFWCSFCSLLTGRGSSPGQPSAQIQMVPRWLRTGFGVSSASNTI